MTGLKKGGLALALAITLCADLAWAQLSAPVAEEGHISVDGNKFLQNHADLDNSTAAGGDDDSEVLAGACPQNVQVRWMSQASSSVYATPLITDLYSDGRKDIVVPSFVHYLEVFEGPEGAQAVGWPAFHKSTVHTSPLLYDFDFDGVRDILLATYDGEVLFFKDTGEKLAESLSVPRLKVRKMWYKGLNPDPNNRVSPDSSDGDSGKAGGSKERLGGDHQAQGGSKDSADGSKDGSGGSASGKEAGKAPVGGDHQVRHVPKQLTPETREQVDQYVKRMEQYRSKYGEAAAKQLLEETQRRNPAFYKVVMADLATKNTTGSGSAAGDGQVSGGTTDSSGSKTAIAPVDKNDSGSSGHAGVGGDHQVHGSSRRLMAADGEGGEGGGVAKVQGVEAGNNALSDEAVESFEVFEDEGGDAVKNDAKAVDGDAQAGKAGAGDKADEAGDAAGANKEGAEDGEDYHSTNLYMDAAEILENLPDLDTDEQYDEFGDSFPGDDEHGGMEDRPPGGPTPVSELDKEHYDHLYMGDYANMARHHNDWMEKNWEDEQFEQTGSHSLPRDSRGDEWVFVDAHILTTPAIADIDGDGHEELVVPVSYFFDREYYDDPEHAKELGGIDIGKYVASGIVVFDLRTRNIKWEQHLDLSTDATTFKAYAYASPTLVDLDKDGKLEVVMGTSMGFLYVLESDGKPRAGWPLQMGEIQGQALVLDINNDGKLEIVAGDTRGNIAAFTITGEELWSRHVKSLIAQGVTAGDINGDGDLELLFGTGSGHVYAIKGVDGLDIENFPFRTHGRVHAPVLITRLADGPAQHAIVASFDGYLYMIDGITGCADTIDIGETSYSMVLADDLDGNGRMDLVLATMNGNIYALETPAEYHPLKTWPSQVMGANGMLARHDYFGVYATAASRQARDVAGEKLHLQISIVDKRGLMLPNGTMVQSRGGPYNVSVVLKGVGVKEMNAGPQPVIGVADTFAQPGTYSLELPCPRTRTTATVHIELVDAQTGHILTDEFSLSFHLHFHKLLKWLIALPPLIMALAVVGVIAAARKRREEEEGEEPGLGKGIRTDLPSFYPHLG